jgi:hypothetical protein
MASDMRLQKTIIATIPHTPETLNNFLVEVDGSVCSAVMCIYLLCHFSELGR